MQNFLNIDMGGMEDDDRLALLGQVWHLVHSIAATKGIRFQVDFPDWVSPVLDSEGRLLKKGDFGDMLVIYAGDGDIDVLKAELAQHRMFTRELAHLDGPFTTSKPTVFAFVRNRTHERTTSNYAARAARRRQRRIEQGKSQREMPVSGQAAAPVSLAPVNFIRLKSATNGNTFALAVERQRVGDGSSAKPLNTFGLGNQFY